MKPGVEIWPEAILFGIYGRLSASLKKIRRIIEHIFGPGVIEIGCKRGGAIKHPICRVGQCRVASAKARGLFGVVAGLGYTVTWRDVVIAI